jgi:hypothetical protein
MDDVTDHGGIVNGFHWQNENAKQACFIVNCVQKTQNIWHGVMNTEIAGGKFSKPDITRSFQEMHKRNWSHGSSRQNL